MLFNFKNILDLIPLYNSNFININYNFLNFVANLLIAFNIPW